VLLQNCKTVFWHYGTLILDSYNLNLEWNFNFTWIVVVSGDGVTITREANLTMQVEGILNYYFTYHKIK
jgi:hypothetical protein